MSDRLPPIPPDQWTEAQRAAAEDIIRGPRGALIQPFQPLLRSPELTGHVQRLGEYLRYRSALDLRLSELGILLVARHWTQPVEWAIHVPIALKAGLAASTVAAVAAGRPPVNLPADEQAVVEVATALHTSHQVDDATWTGALAVLGEQALVDLLGLLGYYGMLAMVMNAARTPAPLLPEGMPALA